MYEKVEAASINSPLRNCAFPISIQAFLRKGLYSFFANILFCLAVRRRVLLIFGLRFMEWFFIAFSHLVMVTSKLLLPMLAVALLLTINTGKVSVKLSRWPVSCDKTPVLYAS